MDPPWWGPGPGHEGSEGLAPVPAVPGLEVLLLRPSQRGTVRLQAWHSHPFPLWLGDAEFLYFYL